MLLNDAISTTESIIRDLGEVLTFMNQFNQKYYFTNFSQLYNTTQDSSGSTILAV